MKKEERVQRAISVLSDENDSIVISFCGNRDMSVGEMLEEFEQNKAALFSIHKDKYKFIIKSDGPDNKRNFYIQILKKKGLCYKHCLNRTKISLFTTTYSKNFMSYNQAFEYIKQIELEEKLIKLSKKTFK